VPGPWGSRRSSNLPSSSELLHLQQAPLPYRPWHRWPGPPRSRWLPACPRAGWRRCRALPHRTSGHSLCRTSSSPRPASPTRAAEAPRAALRARCSSRVRAAIRRCSSRPRCRCPPEGLRRDSHRLRLRGLRAHRSRRPPPLARAPRGKPPPSASSPRRWPWAWRRSWARRGACKCCPRARWCPFRRPPAAAPSPHRWAAWVAA